MSLKEFKFAESYLNILADILKDLYTLMRNHISEKTPDMFDSSENLIKIQGGIEQISKCTECFLASDKLSKNACRMFILFMKIVYKYLESYETLDQYSILKIRQSLHEFLQSKETIFSCELYYIFRAKRLMALIDSVVEKNMNINESKVKILNFMHDIDFVMLPKMIFLSHKTPKLKIMKDFLSDLGDKHSVSSLKEHIISVEVELGNYSDDLAHDWSIETILVIKDAIFYNVKMRKNAIKMVQPIIIFQFLVEFTAICEHIVAVEINLKHSNGYLVDKLSFNKKINVV